MLKDLAKDIKTQSQFSGFAIGHQKAVNLAALIVGSRSHLDVEKELKKKEILVLSIVKIAKKEGGIKPLKL